MSEWHLGRNGCTGMRTINLHWKDSENSLPNPGAAYRCDKSMSYTICGNFPSTLQENFFCHFFFCEVDLDWDPRTQARWPIAPYLSFKFIGGYLGVLPPYQATIPLSLTSFICSGSILTKPKVCILIFSNTRHSHRMCTDVSFSAPNLLHEGEFPLLILCSMYCRLICPFRSSTNILQCFLSSLLIIWAYLSVGPCRHSWLVPYFSQTFHSVCFLFSIQLLILDLNLL